MCPQVQLLNNDSSSSSARPGAQAPSKLAAPPATRSDPGVWANFWRQQEGQPRQQAQQAQPLQQAQQAPGPAPSRSPVQPVGGKPPSPGPQLPAEAALSSLQAAAAAQQQQHHEQQQQQHQHQQQVQQVQHTAVPDPQQGSSGKHSPVTGRQRPLEALLEQHAAAEPAGAAAPAGADAAVGAHAEAAAAAQQRQQLVDQWQGMTLSQVKRQVVRMAAVEGPACGQICVRNAGDVKVPACFVRPLFCHSDWHLLGHPACLPAYLFADGCICAGSPALVCPEGAD